jgi:hypothetical protein
VKVVPLEGHCHFTNGDPHNVNEGGKMMQMSGFHLRCPAPGVVLEASYEKCEYLEKQPCQNTLPRDEISSPCPDDPRVACIYYLTNDGNYKTIYGKYKYMPDPPPPPPAKPK